MKHLMRRLLKHLTKHLPSAPGDLDELPKAHVVHALRQKKNADAFPVILRMPLWRFSFACIDRDWKDQTKMWPGTVGTYRVSQDCSL